jgi:hypothetical protein
MWRICVSREFWFYAVLPYAQLTLRPPPDTRQGYALETCRRNRLPYVFLVLQLRVAVRVLRVAVRVLGVALILIALRLLHIS